MCLKPLHPQLLAQQVLQERLDAPTPDGGVSHWIGRPGPLPTQKPVSDPARHLPWSTTPPLVLVPWRAPRSLLRVCVDAAWTPPHRHGLDNSLSGAAAAQTMSGLGLTPPTPLRIQLKQMARELLQNVG